MFRKLMFLFLLALAPGYASAQACGTADLIAELGPDDRAELDALVAAHPYPVGKLFTATKPGSTVTVVGTIHIPDPRLSPIADRIEPLVKSADVLVLEVSSEEEAGLQALAAQQPGLFFITEGPTLIDLLSEEEWALAKERLAAIGIPEFLAAKFQPWYLSMTLGLPPCAMALMKSGELGLDRQLETVANAAGVPVATLDEMEDILRIFADESLEAQLDGLRVTLETQADGDDGAATLIKAYFEDRIRESWEFGRIQVENSGIENGAEMFEEIDRQILVGRNAGWEPKIASLVEGKDAVIAVGAAHLSGESGVLRALERAGYTVSPL